MGWVVGYPPWDGMGLIRLGTIVYLSGLRIPVLHSQYR